MNKSKRTLIADRIMLAKNRLDKAFGSYKPYLPTLDHEQSLAYLDEATTYIEEARKEIQDYVKDKTTL